MACALSDQGKSTEALEIFTRVFEIQKKVFGKESPEVERTQANIAGVIFDLYENFEQALNAYKGIYRNQIKSLGYQHDETKTTRNIMTFIMSKKTSTVDKWL
jgi:hypothetical protein